MRQALLTATLKKQLSGRKSFASLSSTLPQEGIEDLEVQIRDKAGTHHSSRLRKAGKTPGTLFSLPDNATKLIWFDSKEIAAKMRVFGRKGLCSRMFNLHLNDADGTSRETFQALPKIVHVNSVTDDVENVNFMWAPEERFISAKIPIQVTGHEISPAVKGGGYPNTIRKTIHLRCEASKVPTRIEIDISAMSMGSRVMLEDLNLPEGVQVLEKHDHPVLKMIRGSGGGKD
ncbi:hypothetical protein WJX84_009198 [Apatococcus fuscideae]|uniref:50S ribosomal protein L25 n=1 Tax=Apatococcus fuscideae TaxID=2026836 RepID=A0AAW1T5I4_9CHLO